PVGHGKDIRGLERYVVSVDELLAQPDPRDEAGEVGADIDRREREVAAFGAQRAQAAALVGRRPDPGRLAGAHLSNVEGHLGLLSGSGGIRPRSASMASSGRAAAWIA